MCDITELKIEESSRVESEQRFVHALQATRDGIWDWEVQSGMVYFSPQWARLLCYQPDEVSQRVEFFYEILHPDDMPTVKNLLMIILLD